MTFPILVKIKPPVPKCTVYNLNIWQKNISTCFGKTDIWICYHGYGEFGRMFACSTIVCGVDSFQWPALGHTMNILYTAEKYWLGMWYNSANTNLASLFWPKIPAKLFKVVVLQTTLRLPMLHNPHFKIERNSCSLSPPPKMRNLFQGFLHSRRLSSSLGCPHSCGLALLAWLFSILILGFSSVSITPRTP